MLGLAGASDEIEGGANLGMNEPRASIKTAAIALIQPALARNSEKGLIANMRNPDQEDRPR